MTTSLSTTVRHRLAKLKRRGAVLCTVVATLGAAALTFPVAASSAALYPDLRMMSPGDLQFVKAFGEERYDLRFTTRPWNAGEGPLEIGRTPQASGIADLKQRIYEEPAGFRDEPIGTAVIGTSSIFTFNVPFLARYELWKKHDLDRAEARDFKRGKPLYARNEVSHCLADREQVHEDALGPVYAECNAAVTGLSVGWADVESSFGETQAIDVGASFPPDGDYAVRVIVDPENLLFESDGKGDPLREGETANAAVSYFRLINGEMAGVG